MKKIVPKSCFLISLSFDSKQFQQYLMTKSETHLGFKPLGDHKCIKRNIKPLGHH